MTNYNLNSTRSKVHEDNNILYLQNIFLQNGIHKIEGEEIIFGKKIMNSLLNSLNHFRMIACITESHQSSNDSVMNLFEPLKEQKDKSLITFFLNDFYYDFLWIDESKQLISNQWYKLFHKYLIDFNFDKSMPIIIFSYI